MFLVPLAALGLGKIASENFQGLSEMFRGGISKTNTFSRDFPLLNCANIRISSELVDRLLSDQNVMIMQAKSLYSTSSGGESDIYK